MRICILTQPFGANYGGLLQAYALQKVLRDMGHEVTTLRFKPPLYIAPSKRNLYWQTFRRFLSRLRGNKDIIRCNPTRQSEYYFEVCQELERFINTNINYLRVDTPIELDVLPEFDLFLVGSDQVWRPAYSPYLPNFYLDFLGDLDVKRIAYAASFGVDTWEANDSMTELIKPCAKKFDLITVREESGIQLCKDYLDVDAIMMPDPTLLLKKEEYLDLIQHATIESYNTPYIATYILDPDLRVSRLINAFSEDTHLPIVQLGKFNWETGADSIESWLSGIANAKYVITDSFHGTVFSLIFEKDFITFNNSNRGASRFSSLAHLLEIEDRIIKRDTDKIEINPLNFPLITKRLAVFQKKGLSFLENLSIL